MEYAFNYRLRYAWLTLLLCELGCTGMIGDTDLVAEVDEAHCDDGSIHTNSASLRRLTAFEYDNTVRDLLGDSSRPAATAGIVDTAEENGFNTDAEQQKFDENLLQQFGDLAYSLSTSSLSTARDKILPCAEETAECGASFIAVFGKRAFRRPLADDETQSYGEFFETMRTSYDFDTATQLVVEAMLQSSAFLYRPELPTEEAVSRVSGYEMASRLSYLFLRSMPDDELFAKADAGVLTSPEEILTEAQRLLADPRTQEGSKDFFDQWFAATTITTTMHTDPAFTPAVQTAMLEEFRRDTQEAAWSGDDMLVTLFGSTSSFVNEPLAAFYGAAGVVGDEYRSVELGEARRGILTRGAWLGIHSAEASTKPVTRGVFVLRRVLCEELGDPPPDAGTLDTSSASVTSVRSAYDAHTSQPTCAVCHKKIDPLGFAFEGYSASGAVRDRDDNDFPVDASGSLQASMVYTDGADDESIAFANAAELASIFAASDRVAACVVQQYYEYATSHTTDEADTCSTRQVNQQFVGSGNSFGELLLAVTQTDAFLYRRNGDVK